MSSVVDGVFGLIIAALAVGVLATSIRYGYLRRYFFVNLSVAVMLLCDATRYFILYRYGFRSAEYFYCFYFTDALLVTSYYLLILGFFDVIFSKTPLRIQVRLALLFFVVLVGAMSHQMISQSLPHFYSRLLVEFLQNMYFAAVLLSVLLWISLNYLRVEDRQMALLIAGLGLSFSMQAAGYAVQNLMPREMFENLNFLLRRASLLATTLRLALWCKALTLSPQPVAVRAAQPEMVGIQVKGTA